MKELAKKAPLHSVAAEHGHRHLPNPLEAQKIRIPIIWKGDMESPWERWLFGRERPVAHVTKRSSSIPRRASRRRTALLREGPPRSKELWVIACRNHRRADGADDRRPGPDSRGRDHAGNVVAVVGLKDADRRLASDDKEMQTFEKIVHYSDPVVTIAVEAKSTSDLPGSSKPPAHREG